MKKIRRTSHPEKFELRALDRHHIDYILLLFDGSARKSTLFFFFLVTIALSHSPFARKLHPTPCMHDVCCVCGLGPSHTSKQNVLSLILLILLAKFMNQKKGICRHRILYPLRLRPSFPNNAQTLEPNQISN